MELKPGDQSKERNDGKNDEYLDGSPIIKHHGADHTHNEQVKMQVRLKSVSQSSFDEVDKTAADMKEKSLFVFPAADQEESH